MTVYAPAAASCSACGFTTRDLALLGHHSCDVQAQGGRCEDYPCCGHERGDCNGELYGSDEAIKAEVHRLWSEGHGYCDHAEGIYQCEDYGDDECPGFSPYDDLPEFCEFCDCPRDEH